MLFCRWPPGVSEALTDLCQSDLTLCPALLTVQPGGDPGARNLSSVEEEEPLLPRVVPMISVSAGSHASSSKCRSDFSLLPNLERANLKVGPPLGPHPSSSLVVLGTQVIAWECGPGWREGMREKDLRPHSSTLSVLLFPSPFPTPWLQMGAGED